MNPFSNKHYGIKSKNVGPFLAFGGEWFAKYQDWLLFLLNVPIIRLWTRWIFRMDTRYRDIIVQIEPGNFKVLLPDGQIQGDFRTHPKFSKRVYFAFRWWWWGLHYLDELFKVTIPRVSFGFDTLTAYPDPDPETSTVDGYVRDATRAAWATIIAAAGTSANDSSSDDYLMYVRGYADATFDRQHRGIFLFDTSSIGSTPVITSATLSIHGSTSANPYDADPSLTVVISAPASNTSIVAGDYDSLGSTSLSNYIDFTSYNTSGYNAFVLTETSVISKTSITKLGTKTDWKIRGPFGGTTDGTKNLYMKCLYAEDATGTKDPKLVVVYSSSSIKTIAGVAIASVKTASGVAKASIKKIIGLA